jgi:ParB-like chromosome segregation protein Spo0J
MTAPYQVMPALNAEDFEALKTDIEARGVVVPVEYDEHGNVIDGHHRVRACEELGITTWPRIERRGLTEEGKRAHARALNLARRHLTQAQRRLRL